MRAFDVRARSRRGAGRAPAGVDLTFDGEIGVRRDRAGGARGGDAGGEVEAREAVGLRYEEALVEHRRPTGPSWAARRGARACRRGRAGSVLPARSTMRAPDGDRDACRRRRRRCGRRARRSSGSRAAAAPVPSMTRACRSTTTGASTETNGCTSGARSANDGEAAPSVTADGERDGDGDDDRSCAHGADYTISRWRRRRARAAA